MALACALVAFLTGALVAGDGNRLAYLDELDPYWPCLGSPRLTTPMWIGPEDAAAGVEAAIVLSIDDMSDPERYEAYLRPILARLQQLEGGREPLSIFTCSVDPAHPRLQQFLAQGVSLEVHTLDHPCPLFRGGDLALAIRSTLACVDLLTRIPGNRPVAFRMPCCDSVNTSSPRFYDQVFSRPGEESGLRLVADSSIAMAFTSDDPELPRELVQEPDGSERFLKYLPADRSFANTIRDYPYPYFIGRDCLELPWIVPTDWQAQHRHGPNQQQTLDDLQAALDLTVLKQGLFTLVFHPHGWIQAEQIVALIDHAVATHARRVKFLSVRDVEQRIARWLPRSARLVDLDADGRLDRLDAHGDSVLGVIHPDGRASALDLRTGWGGSWGPAGWSPEPGLTQEIDPGGTRRALAADGSARLLDLDGDGCCELLRSQAAGTEVSRWDSGARAWRRLQFDLPCRCRPTAQGGRGEGVRFVDLDEDGDLDLVVSGFHEGEHERGVWLFESHARGWTRRVETGPLPAIVRADGGDNGMWVRDRALWWVNEDTDGLPHQCDRRGFTELLAPAYPLGTEPPPRSPAASLRALHPRPGFACDLVAAEPLVADPVSIEWGADGKLWVVEMGDYPLGIAGGAGPPADPFGTPGGRVRFLEDADGDGRYERATTFLDSLPFPTSVMPWRDGVLVAAAPDLFFAADRDGDGRADFREVLVTGFQAGNPQHRVNGLRFGLDGWLYGANGDSGGTLRLKGGPELSISGRDWRIDPERGLLEPESGETQYGRERDDFGHWFGCNNVNPCWHFALEDRWLRRNPFAEYPDARVDVPRVAGSAPVFPLSLTRARFNDVETANHFTSACSPCIYRDELFGPAFSSSLFVCEPVHNLVHREVLERTDGGITSARAADESSSEFLASSDSWFRPVQARTGPDGALWVVDMYRDVIEHPEWIPEETQARLDLRAGAGQGRIYRVWPVTAAPRPFERMDGLSLAELAEAIGDPNGWRRDTAERLLLERLGRRASAPAVAERLAALARESPRLAARIQAAWTLAVLGIERIDVLAALLGDSAPEAQRNAIRLVAESGSLPSRWPAEIVRRIRELARASPAALVRREAIAALPVLLQDGADCGAQLAECLLAARARPATAGLEEAVVLSGLSPRTLAGYARRLLAEPEANEDLLVAAVPMACRWQAADALAELLAASVPDALGSEPLLTPWRARLAAALLEQLDERRDDLRSMRARLAEACARARAAIRDESTAPEQRALLLPLLGHDPEEREHDLALAESLLAPAEPPAVQTAALAALVATRDGSVPARLLRGWSGHAPLLREAIVAELLGRARWTRALLDALQSGPLAADDLSLVQRQRLLGSDDEDVRGRAARLFEARGRSSRQAALEAQRPALALAGDTARGAAVFERACASCHLAGGIGHAVGPDLAAVADQSPETLLISILDPNRALEPRYLSYVASTKLGHTATGIIARETSASVTLLDSGGQETTILRSDLDELQSARTSLMPEGLEEGLGPQDLADLLAFLRLRPPPAKSFAGNAPTTVRPDELGVPRLRAAQAAIRGPSLVFEAQYQNLGYWSDARDHATWTLELLRPGLFEVRLDYACQDASAGNALTLEAGGQLLTHTVAGTGTWDDYREVVIGRLALAAGRVELDIRPATPPRSALLDLRTVLLVPVKE